jgi:uncharacterized membrane protein YoaK (UPF0700 family)
VTEQDDAPVPGRVVAPALAVLAAAAGALDAICVLRLGGLFASVITGNLVQLGRAIATVDATLTLGAVTAVGGYAVGVAAGTAALASAGMGLQSMIAASSGVPGGSTTFLTGTLTDVVRVVATKPRRFRAAAGGAGRLAALLGGAAAGALLLQVAPLWAHVLPLVLVAAVLMVAARAGRR